MTPLDRLRAALTHADQHAWPVTNVHSTDLAWALKLPDKVAALADELSERGWQHEDVPGMLLRLLSEPAREPEQRRGDLSVYLALADNSRRPWAVCATREAAIEALDDYLERCWRGTKIMMDWVLLTTPEAEPVWARYFTADGMSDSPKEQLIERRKVRSLLSEPATPPSEQLAARVRALVDEPDEDLRMDAYYYGFEPTGVTAIDRILSAIAHAGKAYHHTESWNDDWAGRGNYLPHGGDTAVDAIQNAANAAAARLRSLLSEPPTDAPTDPPADWKFTATLQPQSQPVTDAAPTDDSQDAQYLRAVATHGPCSCDPDFCLQEGGECAFCSALDPEWPCPAEQGAGYPATDAAPTGEAQACAHDWRDVADVVDHQICRLCLATRLGHAADWLDTDNSQGDA